MKHMRYYVTLFLWLACACMAMATNTDLQNVRVGYYQIPGFHNLDSTGQRSGYGYDFLQQVRRYRKVEFTYTGYDKSWQESLQLLQAGQIDLLTGALKTPERERMFDYSFPIGSTQLNLYVSNKDTRYKPHEYPTYEGMRIGTVGSEMLDDRVRALAHRQHFSCHIVTYSTFEDMYAALRQGQVDAICAIGTHLVQGFRILDSFDNEPIYAMVRKGDKTLLDLLNDAILQMDQSDTMWPQQMFQKNYMTGSALNIEFSDRELDFIRRHSTPETAIIVATDNDWRPYSWYENGKHHGIVVEILDSIMQYAGLKYQLINGHITDERILEQNHQVDLYIAFASTKQYAEERHLVVSPSFMTSSVAIVSHKNYDQLHVLGLADNTPMLNHSFRKIFTNYTFTTFPNTEKLIEAVNQGLIDGAVLYDHVAQLSVNGGTDDPLRIHFVPGVTLPLHMVSRIEDDRELITIISKGINHLSTNQLNNIITRYLSVPEQQISVWKYMKKNLWLPILLLAILASVLFAERYYRMRTIQKKDAHARELAEKANNAKTSFLFSMSHDIRTPMNAIMGFRDLLEKNQDDPQKRADYLRKIDESSHVLLSIINNVLEMARIEKGALELNETVWSTEQFSDILYSIFSDMMAKKGLQFHRQMNLQHPYVYCDPIKLREVFINILSNAYKYTQKGSVSMTVDELPCEREGWAYYRNTITDTGMGMSEEFLPHLFEEFSREHNTTENKIEGTGLGMPIVKRLVELMNGTIEVKSKKGEGTTFIVTLPLRIADRSNLIDPASVVVDIQQFEGKRILLAEDNDLNAEIAMEILGEQGFIIDRAEDGQICCDMLAQAPAKHYDLVLMDIQMPNMNGYEAARCIRKMEDLQKACIPILAMTANAFEEDKRNALRAGMNGHLTKPIDVQVLMQTLAATIQGNHLA